MANIDQTNELTNYQQWQLEKYGNIIPDINVTPEGDLYESGLEELDRLAEWINAQAEQQEWRDAA